MGGWRSIFFLSSFFLLAAIIIGCLFYIQVINHKFYQAQVLGQQPGFAEIEGVRGEIFFGNKKNDDNPNIGDLKSLAINKDKWLVAAMAAKIEDKNQFALTLGQVPGLSKEFILNKLESANSYVVIKKDLSEEELKTIKELDLDSAVLENIPSRYYPQGAMLAQTIGFVGGNNDGQYGIEGYYDDILKGKKGIQEAKRGLNLIDSQAPEDLNGSNLYLTIDYNIQFQAESLLKEAQKNIGIDSGQIIVLEPQSGKILALANFPSFDVNKYSKEANLAIFQDSAVQKLFEPGSVFKPFIMAMALQEGKVTKNTTFVDTGSVAIGPDTISNFNHEIYGRRDMSGILEKSINTGAVYVSRLIPHSIFNDYLDKLGFTEKTGVDLQGEAYSENEILKNGSDFGFATASFGQGVEMTPIQLARAFCIFANGGKLVKPYIVQKIVHGQDEQILKPHIVGELISSATASQVTTMLINVVERGFGDGAKIPGYYLAGKTGTAQVPFENKKGYYPDKTIQSFIGFGPALKPKFLILVKLDNPKVPKSSLSAVPIFKKLSQYIINYWQIPPDYDVALPST